MFEIPFPIYGGRDKLLYRATYPVNPDIIKSIISCQLKTHAQQLCNKTFSHASSMPMIGCRLLLEISKALNDAKQNQLPFGGLNIIFAGDFAQLPPVGETRLFSHINIRDARSTKHIWKVTVVIGQYRRHYNGNHEAAGTGKKSVYKPIWQTDNFNVLNSKQLKTSDFMNPNVNWGNVPIIVSNNESKLNVRATVDFAAKAGRQMHGTGPQTAEGTLRRVPMHEMLYDRWDIKIRACRKTGTTHTSPTLLVAWTAFNKQTFSSHRAHARAPLYMTQKHKWSINQMERTSLEQTKASSATRTGGRSLFHQKTQRLVHLPKVNTHQMTYASGKKNM